MSTGPTGQQRYAKAPGCGIAGGAAIGLAFGNVALGIGADTAIGVALGASGTRRRRER
jgi:hypothetical protein